MSLSGQIVLLPGLACDAAIWHDQLAPLGTLGTPVSVTDVHTREPDLPRMATALLAETTGRLILIGTSMGGMLALHCCRQAPQRIAAMALLSTSARADTAELIALRGQAIELFEQGMAEQVLRANLHFAFHPRHVRQARFSERYVQSVLGAGVDQLIGQNRAIMRRADMRPWLAAVHCPCLVACGDTDLLTPLEHSQEIAERVPGARLEVITDAGHMMTWEQPDAVNTMLLQWLTRL